MAAAVALIAVTGIGVSSAGAAQFAYVTGGGRGIVSVINTATDSVVAIVTVGKEALGAAVTPNGAFVYVAEDSGLAVLDATTNRVVAEVPLKDGFRDVAVTPNGAFVYATSRKQGVVVVIDTATNKVVASPRVGGFPHGVAITPNGAFALVADEQRVALISTSTNRLVASAPVGPEVTQVAIAPSGALAYLLSRTAQEILIFDTSSKAVVGTIPVAYPEEDGMALTPSGGFLYTSVNPESLMSPFLPGAVSVISTATDSVVANLPVGLAARDVAITSDGAFAYAISGGFPTERVSIFSTATYAALANVYVQSADYVVVGPNVRPARAHRWSRARCTHAYRSWVRAHPHATRRQKKTEANVLHRAHGCAYSSLR